SSTQHKGVSPDFALPSAFSAEEFGESSQPSALPWDMIRSTTFTKTGKVSPTTIKLLQTAFQSRLKSKPELLKLKEDLERWKKLKETNSIALNYDKRKKELDDQKKKPDETQAVMDVMAGSESVDADGKKVESKEKDKHAKDAYLKETQQILADWVKRPAAPVKTVAKK
ncbi:MAG: C-terminal processing peptidase, partial [Bacteroidota bacterium]